MTKHLSNPAGIPARTLFAAVAISPFLFTSCLSRSDRETIDIPPPVGDAAANPVDPVAAASVDGVPPVPAEPTPPPYSLDGAVKYVVQPGDSLSTIAAKHNASVGDVMKVNKILNANKIRAGQTLLLPGEEKDASETAVETAAEAVGEAETPTATTPAPTPTVPTTPALSGTEGKTLPSFPASE